MRLEFLLQFIVPLTFLAIWALTSLLNRDAQPLPPRPGAGRGPGLGPARGGPGGGFSPSARAELAGPGRSTAAGGPASSMADRATPARWSAAAAQGNRPGAVPSRTTDDGIVIIESKTRPAQGSSSFSPSSAASSPRVTRGSGPASRRAASRARSTPAPSLKPMEADKPRALTGLVGQSLSQKPNKPLDIVPLSTAITPISSPLISASTLIAPEAHRAAAAPVDPPLSIGELRAMLASPKRLREVALLGELLQPPVSLRGSRRPH